MSSIKPRVRQAPSPAADEAAALAVINRGLAPAPDPSADRAQKFTLRLPGDVYRQVEAAAAARPGRLSMNTWIVEAIVAKLREEGA